MKFDVVIGNPPYNNDIYLDFVQLGHKISTEYTLMITPAKWQGKGGGKNEQFRKTIVPYMSHITFYPDCGDIFDIGDVGGISYFILNKQINSLKEITNRCNTNKNIDKSVAYRDIKQCLSCYCDSIIDKINTKNEKKIKLDTVDKFNYMITTPPAIGGAKGASSFLFGASGMCQCLKLGKIYEYEDAKLLSGCYGVLCSGKTREEVTYKWSYFNTRFIRFLVLVGMCTQSTLTDETWRFVPAPKAFDHIFTDEELYKKYNLTDEEINIIESVIKERK